MAPLSFSPDTSTSSHTLSAGSIQPPPMELNSATAPSSFLRMPATFLQPTRDLNLLFLQATKRYLDPLAAGVNATQSERLQLSRKRKRPGYDAETVLKLKKLHLEGFGSNAVFEQARKIIDSAADEVALSLPEEQDDTLAIAADEDSGEELDDTDLEESESSLGEEGVDWEYDGDQVSGEEGLDEEGFEDAQSEDEDIEEMEEDEEGMFSDDVSDDEPAETYRPDKFGLDDGFFSIDTFNKQSELLEQADVRGEAVDDDDEEIDWTADPLSMRSNLSKSMGGEEDVSEDESEEGGPTFGNADLNAPFSDDDDEPLEDGDMDLGGDMNANNVMYKDFFAPPARKAGKNRKKKGRPNPHNFPAADDPQNNRPDMEDGEDMERNVQNAISRVQRDLFEDDDDVESEQDDLSDLDPSDPKSRRSTHERRQARIMEEIRKLEAANVAKRDWQLSGEARAIDRPLNSLLEEGDLEYERAGKPVPVITAEVNEDMEALIKRRILSGQFDEVIRRRPDDLVTGPKVRRGQFELDDSKAQKSLAELYEEDHLRQTDPNYVDARDEKLKKEHQEIESMWKVLCGKLDSLSSSHFKPKPSAPNLEIRVDAPAIEMEDARPTAGGEVAGASMLAPQELYKPGEDKDKSEIVTKGGMPVSREEMTREQKLRRRRREKERIKKAGLNEPRKEEGGKEKRKRENKQLLGDLKKGGVQVIGKGGEVTDIEGREIGKDARKSAGAFKL